MALGLEHVPKLFDVVVLLGLIAALAYVGIGQRAPRAFAVYLAVAAMSDLLPMLAQTSSAPAIADYWWRVAPYFWLAYPTAVLHFALVYPHRRKWLPRALPVGTILFAAATVPCVIYAVDHASYWGEGVAPGSLAQGPLAKLIGPWAGPSLTLVAAMLVRDYLRAPPGPTRRSLYLVSLGFSVVAMYAGLFVLGGHVLFGAGSRLYGDSIAQWIALVFRSALLLFIVGAFSVRAARANEAEARSDARRFLASLAATIVLVAAYFAIRRLDPSDARMVDGVFSSVVDLAFAILIAYALVRQRLFGIELRAKWGIKQGTVLASAVLLYVVVTLLAQSWWPVAVPYVGLMTVLLLVPAFPVLRSVGQRVAEAAMPGVERSPEYLDARKLEVYRVALEDAMVEHDVLPESHERALAALRVKLGVTDRDHAVLEHAARAARAGGAHRVRLEPGALILGRYEVERLLGEGGMARTYLANDEENGGQVVVKALQPDRRGVDDLLREARAIASVQHPRVVRLLGVDHVGGEAFLVMEYLEGGSLADRLRRGPLGVNEFRGLGRDLLDALEAVHEAGLVHRDVKPSNVLLTREGTAKLGDFGVAHIQGFETTIGGVGQAVGTVRFMSPEQARGRPATPRSDLFSAAATLYETYTGQPYLPAKAGETSVELQIRAAQASTFGRLLSGPEALRAWFAIALDPEPPRRFGSAREMREALEAVLADVTPGTSSEVA